jgi:hypothetical protein
MARRSPKRESAARAIKHIRRLVSVGHCGEAAAYLRDNPPRVRPATLVRLHKAVASCRLPGRSWMPATRYR